MAGAYRSFDSVDENLDPNSATNGWGVDIDDVHSNRIIIERCPAHAQVNCYDRNLLTPQQARTLAQALLSAADTLDPSAPPIA